MHEGTIRAGLVGAGYISSWHAEALASVPGVVLAAVCDPLLPAATALADAHGARAFASVGDLLADGGCDAVHILTPPNLHRDLAIRCIDAGLHVLVEKPFALSADDAAAMVAAAYGAGRAIAVNHNFLGLPSYVRLKRARADGTLGRIDSADLRWRFPLAPLRSGPFGLWMLRDPGNLLLEVGPHLYAFAIDLFGSIDDLALRVGKPIAVPGSGVRHQSWRIWGRSGDDVDVSIDISLVEGTDDRSLALRGSSGAARLDFANDVLVLDRPNAADLVVNPMLQQLSQAGQHLRAGGVNAVRQLTSLNRRSPYALGFHGAIAAFYDAVRTGSPVDPRFSGASAVAVVAALERTLAQLPATELRAVAPAASAASAAPDILVIGGTGFIGRYLTRALVASGRRVRVLSRGGGMLFADLGCAVDMVSGSLKDPAALRAAMQGVDTVYHLAKAEEATWAGYLENDVAVTDAVAAAALDAGVRRFIYTGTIAAYDASRRGRPITEETGFGDMRRRNLYARSKALCESRLMALHHERGLPVAIARPGVVLGEGGPLQHWGIGRWHGAGAVRIWGDGRNLLPFVLVEDVAEALVLMLDAPGIDGQSFNLVGEPMLSARGYFDAIHAATDTRIAVSTGSLDGFYLMDVLKYRLKRHVLRRQGMVPPSRIDWRSRAHLSPFRNDHAKTILGWRPETDPHRFIARAIVPRSLFGY